MKCEKRRTCDSIKETEQRWGVCVWLCQARVGLFRQAIKAIWLPDEVFRKGQQRGIKSFWCFKETSLSCPSLFIPSSCPSQCHPTYHSHLKKWFRFYCIWILAWSRSREILGCFYSALWGKKKKMGYCWVELVEVSRTFWEAVVNQRRINQLLFTQSR